MALRSRSGSALGARPPVPRGEAHRALRRRARGPDGRRGRPRDTRLDAFRAGRTGAAGRQARASREAALRLLRRGARARRAQPRAGARADAGPHIRLQPAGERDPLVDHVGRAGRALLHLLEPREPRPASVGRQRRVGSRPARLLDPALLAGRDPGAHLGGGAGLHPPDPAGRGVRRPRLRERNARPRRDVVARAEQAAADDDRRLREDGRVRRHEQRAGTRLRLGRPAARSRDLRRVPPHLQDRRHRLASGRCGRAARARAGGLLQRRAARNGAALLARARRGGRPDDRVDRAVARVRRCPRLAAARSGGPRGPARRRRRHARRRARPRTESGRREAGARRAGRGSLRCAPAGRRARCWCRARR